MILILGVTASGKGRLAFGLAQQLDAEIISIDSMKVYRRMNIGTAKPSEQVREQMRHHLIDVVEPSEPFSVGMFLEQTNKAIEEIGKRGRPIIAVGGTALYIKALLYGLFQGPGSDAKIRDELRGRAEAEGLEQLHKELACIDPAAAERIHRNDAKRIVRALEVYKITGKPISSFQQQWSDQSEEPSAEGHNWTIIGLRRDKSDASGRINKRVRKMIDLGLVDEVRSLLAEDKPLSEQARCAIGYAEVIEHLAGGVSLEEAVEKIKINTRRLAKGQRTWFKTFKNVHWLNVKTDEPAEDILARARELLEHAKRD